jgi:hypothetical protein
MALETAGSAEPDLGRKPEHDRGAATGANLIGVFSSDNIEYNGHRGYALVVDADRLVISKRSRAGSGVSGERWLDCYLGSAEGTETTRARHLATALYVGKRREVKEADIAQILYRRSSPFWGGYAIFKTPDDSFRISTAVLSPWNPSAIATTDRLRQSLIVFAARKLYDDKTGRLFVEETLSRSGRLSFSPASRP